MPRGRLGVRVGLAQQRDQPRPPGVGDPGLGAVDDVAVAVPAGARPSGWPAGRSRRRARSAPSWPGSRRSPSSAGTSPAAPRAEREQQLADHRVPAHRARQAHPAARQLGGDQGVAGHGDPAVAPRRGDRQPEDAKLLHLLDELFRVGIGVLKVPHDRPDLTVDPVGDRIDDRPFLNGQGGHVRTAGGQRRRRANRADGQLDDAVVRWLARGDDRRGANAGRTRRYSKDVSVASGACIRGRSRASNASSGPWIEAGITLFAGGVRKVVVDAVTVVGQCTEAEEQHRVGRDLAAPVSCLPPGGDPPAPLPGGRASPVAPWRTGRRCPAPRRRPGRHPRLARCEPSRTPSRRCGLT